jgi:hypothetical protein
MKQRFKIQCAKEQVFEELKQAISSHHNNNISLLYRIGNDQFKIIPYIFYMTRNDIRPIICGKFKEYAPDLVQLIVYNRLPYIIWKTDKTLSEPGFIGLKDLRILKTSHQT